MSLRRHPRLCVRGPAEAETRGLRGLRKLLARFLASSDAVVTVEFGVLLPALLLVFFGAIEVARMQITHVLIERLAIDVAIETRVNCGSVDLDSIVSKYAQEKLEPMLSASSLTVTARSSESVLDITRSGTSGTGSGGDVVRLEVTANLAFLDWLRPSTFSTQQSYVFYFVNEAEEYTYATN